MYNKNASTIKWPSLTAMIGKRRKKSFIGSATNYKPSKEPNKEPSKVLTSCFNFDFFTSEDTYDTKMQVFIHRC